VIEAVVGTAVAPDAGETGFVTGNETVNVREAVVEAVWKSSV